MDKIVDLEKAKILAENIIEAQKEVSFLKSQLKELFKDTNVEVVEYLSNGGTLMYTEVQPKPKFDYQNYAGYLYNLVKRGETLSEQELDKLIAQFTIEREPKWSLKVKK
ncbi:hypothetical protein [Mycoplasmopsis pullorum]|uniref:Uncharacterized protein n=1 Tax=Mycoplasmopsis pullorum TaxID=48003 RepID=A0A1L4FT68_9BACT|nr:hypothetical protein [Mycoplasmopsis pullorum]APJ38817.1 hypothetical protein BLA55_00865 [Mycoplasmopsis pullorum]TNK82177.1 hypothetical protein C4M94_01790 [Mycoplasmopsis pullorum]TNK83247.1 hypothetical protein C4M80_00950 [Mycoplasmopsis pullorum]TNK84695.1 hypothetical protein C4M92_03040 [Mycoplasmopsis pullorum]TNK85194.1 hypothetical protein C4M81_00090 [Mycoplasmopsis pullorum]